MFFTPVCFLFDTTPSFVRLSRDDVTVVFSLCQFATKRGADRAIGPSFCVFAGKIEYKDIESEAEKLDNMGRLKIVQLILRILDFFLSLFVKVLDMPTLSSLSKKSRMPLGISMTTYSPEKAEMVNVEALKGLLAYLKYLHNEDELSDAAYQVLVAQVLSTFVENSIAFKMEQLLGDVDFILQEANKSFLAEMLN